MDFRPSEYQVTITWALSLFVRTTKSKSIVGDGLSNVDDFFDADFTISYSDIGDGEYEWEVTHIDFGNDLVATRLSDPEFWTLVKRCVERDWEAMNEKVVERIREAEGK